MFQMNMELKSNLAFNISESQKFNYIPYFRIDIHIRHQKNKTFDSLIILSNVFIWAFLLQM